MGTVGYKKSIENRCVYRGIDRDDSIGTGKHQGMGDTAAARIQEGPRAEDQEDPVPVIPLARECERLIILRGAQV